MTFRGNGFINSLHPSVIYAIGIACLFIAFGAAILMYMCLNRGNWIGGFMFCPLVIYLSVKKFHSIILRGKW